MRVGENDLGDIARAPQLTEVRSKSRIDIETAPLVVLRLELRKRTSAQPVATPPLARGFRGIDDGRRRRENGDEPLVVAEVSLDAHGGQCRGVVEATVDAKELIAAEPL